MKHSTEHRKIAVLGSTGSIGRNALAVIDALPGCQLCGISGHKNIELLLSQTHHHKPAKVVISDSEFQGQLPDIAGTEFSIGPESVVSLATNPEVDTVVAAIVGRAGLESSIAAVRAGKRLALANKETLVVAGDLITKLAAESGTEILPVDSEHSAIFQCLQSGKSNEVSRLILTASGGPFRDFDRQQLSTVTVEHALAHPTWQMGPKISVDSATMMNKALEIIEARWLFDIEPANISVVIHPQSIIHSMVEFCDGSVISQMGPPDMRLPIQYSLTFPDRVPGNSPRMDFSCEHALELSPPDFDRFPALELGFEVARTGGTSGAVLNAANEAAVAAFLNKQISFVDIVTACREILDNHQFEADPDFETLLRLDLWAREEINKWIAC